jgi:hypothetical protein
LGQNELKLAYKRLYLKIFPEGFAPGQPHGKGGWERRRGEGKGKGGREERERIMDRGGCVITLGGMDTPGNPPF